MMFDFHLILDIFFLFVAIYLFPGIPPQRQAQAYASHPNTPIPQQGHIDLPLSSPLPDFLRPTPSSGPTPRIVLHPSHASSTAIPMSVSLNPRPNHKRKSVSFSISSMTDLLKSNSPPKGGTRQHRPPTPWMKGPASPSEITGLLADKTSPLPSPLPNRSQGSLERQRSFSFGRGGLGVMVQEPDVLGLDEAGEEAPLLISPKICSRDMVDPMGIKKSWLMA